uniref:Nodulation protein NfeD n=1 Tax=Eiseniibacteriota bacterium TaxID=2212470 RepID=A0A832MLP3_UNCEI
MRDVRGARRRACAGAIGLALAAVAWTAAPRAQDADARAPDGGRVLAVRLEGAVSPVMAEALAAALDRAERGNYRALVIELDTPGGLETSMRAMVKRMLAAGVPIITWVAPSGAHAASAGVFVTMAGDVAAMAPGTNIGAATPVHMGGGMDSTLARKAASDAAAFARTVAAQRGRNVAWAERAVREAVAASDSEAVALGVVDFVAGSMTELLERADGRTWRRGDDARALAVAGLPVERLEPGLRQRLLGILSDPNVAYILLMLGFYGLLFELQNPGAILPGVVGAICIILAFLALSTLPVNAAGIALILLAVAFFLAELKVASGGLLGAGGVVAMLLGSMILFQGEAARLSWTIIVTVTAASAAFFLFVVGAGLRAQRARPALGARALVGRRAEAVERLAPSGLVRIDGELWRAVSEAPVDAGAQVDITGVDGLTLRVRPSIAEARS